MKNINKAVCQKSDAVIKHDKTKKRQKNQRKNKNIKKQKTKLSMTEIPKLN